jgi:glycosyltransferase involved in cell wall biosynthesis
MVDVVLPVLNEAESIGWVLEHMPPGYDPIVVDNGSTDGSGRIARALGARVVEEPTRGFGAACFMGLTAATADIVCFMDADSSLDPTELSRVVEPVKRGEADLVLGERRPHQGAWPAHARLANRLLTFEVRRRTGTRLADIGPMRAAVRRALLDLRLADRGFGWPLEMVLAGSRAGWRIREVPVTYRVRAGRSKVTGTVRGTLRAVKDMGRVLA